MRDAFAASEHCEALRSATKVAMQNLFHRHVLPADMMI